MRVLLLSQYFPPEVGATQARAHDMARALVRSGHEVTVVTELPNHPVGRLAEEDRGKWFERTELDGIEVIRVWVKTSPSKTFWNRIAFYSSFMAMAILAGIFRVSGSFDVIYATSPPLFVGLAGAILGVLRATPLVFEVRDPWPAAAVALGELRSRHAIRAAEWIESLCYEQASRVVTVTESWRRLLLQRGVPEEKIRLVPNGANLEMMRPQLAEAAELRRSLGLEDSFVVLFAGLHGIAQGLDAVLDAAEKLRDEEDIQLVFVGEGPVKSRLAERAKELRLDNIRFLAQVARARVPAFFSMADTALVPLRSVGLLEGAVPTRLLDAWACGCPALVAAGGEARALVVEARGGVCVAPEDAEAMARAIIELRDDPESRRLMGENGFRFVRARFDRKVQARQLVESLEELVAGETAASWSGA